MSWMSNAVPPRPPITARCVCCAVSPHDCHAAAGFGNGSAVLVNLRVPSLSQRILISPDSSSPNVNPPPPSAIAFSCTGVYVAVAADTTISFFHTAMDGTTTSTAGSSTIRPVSDHPPNDNDFIDASHSADITSLTFHPHNDCVLVSSSRDMTCRIWRIHSNMASIIGILAGPPIKYNGSIWSPDGQNILTRGLRSHLAGDSLTLWEASTQKIIASNDVHNPPQQQQFSSSTYSTTGISSSAVGGGQPPMRYRTVGAFFVSSDDIFSEDCWGRALEWRPSTNATREVERLPLNPQIPYDDQPTCFTANSNGTVAASARHSGLVYVRTSTTSGWTLFEDFGHRSRASSVGSVPSSGSVVLGGTTSTSTTGATIIGGGSVSQVAVGENILVAASDTGFCEIWKLDKSVNYRIGAPPAQRERAFSWPPTSTSGT